MPQSPYRLRNDLKCVEWDGKPCTTNQAGQAIGRQDRLCTNQLAGTEDHLGNDLLCVMLDVKPYYRLIIYSLYYTESRVTSL